MDNKELFFSNQNQNFTYEQVQKKVLKETAYDVSKNRNFRSNYNKMALLVFENTPDENKNLVNLNNLLIEKSSNYFCKLINNRKNKSQSKTQSNSINQPRNLPPSVPLPNPPVQSAPTSNVLPFTLNDDFISEISNTDQALYTNTDTLKDNDTKNTMALLEEASKNREIEMDRFTKQFEMLKQNSLSRDSNNNSNTNSNNMSLGRDDALIDTRVDYVQADPSELYRKKNDLTNRMVESMTENNISGNNISLDTNEKGIKEEINKNILTQGKVDEVNNSLYQNTKYSFDRRPSQLVVIQKQFSGDSSINFTESLIEPLIIDKHSDVFLEFINIQNIEYGTDTHIEKINCFALQIDELPLKTASNNIDLYDKYIIPNDSFGLTDNSADGGNDIQTAESYNIKLKSNYMCTINPMKLSTFTVKLYGLQGTTLELLKNNQHGSNSVSEGQLIIGLYIVKHQ